MSDDRNVLLDAVDALTKPIRSKVPLGSGINWSDSLDEEDASVKVSESNCVVCRQWISTSDLLEGEGLYLNLELCHVRCAPDSSASRLQPVKLPSLLHQLDNAIRGTIGKGGSASLAHQRNMLDADALFRFAKISSVIKDWARMAGSRITYDDPAKTLRDWYTAYQTKQVTVDSERFYGRQMEGWAKQITDKLNPPRIWDLPNPCPVCGAATWWSKSTHEEYARPLIVEYHETGANLIQDAKAMCRACEQVWSVRELAYAIETNEGATA